LYTFVKNAPMMVDRRCPTWKFLAMFGEEYSTITFLPFPDSFEPYSGAPEGVSCERLCT